MHIGKKKTKFKNYLWNYACYKKYLQGLMRPAINKENFKSTQLYIILLTWAWRVRKSLFRFHSLNVKFVICVYLQCGRCKQNHSHFIGKTTTIDECVLNLSVGFWWNVARVFSTSSPSNCCRTQSDHPIHSRWQTSSRKMMGLWC